MGALVGAVFEAPKVILPQNSAIVVLFRVLFWHHFSLRIIDRPHRSDPDPGSVVCQGRGRPGTGRQ